MPPPSGRAVSHVWSYFTKEPIENPDIFLCTCQICESQGVKPLVAYNFARGGGTGSFNKHLAKKHGITKETHAASGSGTTSGTGSRQTQWDIPSTGMPFRYNRNDMIDEFSRYVICDELPFNHGESRAYDRYARKTMQPQYRYYIVEEFVLSVGTIPIQPWKNRSLFLMMCLPWAVWAKIGP
ncbi:uncharacterized protein LOC130828594 [Amaranthus tricolor]|uniref:uncharacterized protein LOC130828594 n=1 Tax=Amaranthus tricolor TaxID=29722 RepID=UPI00259104F4|nr:uncharacterized protein LOC130828594 [Amaranthus tricolor]